MLLKQPIQTTFTKKKLSSRLSSKPDSEDWLSINPADIAKLQFLVTLASQG